MRRPRRAEDRDDDADRLERIETDIRAMRDLMFEALQRGRTRLTTPQPSRSKPPFGGPEAVLAYLSRYTHRVAISNTRLISADAQTVAFRWKDYRIKSGDRQKVMRLTTLEFIHRFLIHVLPDGFRRIRHYGLLACSTRTATIHNFSHNTDATVALTDCTLYP